MAEFACQRLYPTGARLPITFLSDDAVHYHAALLRFVAPVRVLQTPAVPKPSNTLHEAEVCPSPSARVGPPPHRTGECAEPAHSRSSRPDLTRPTRGALAVGRMGDFSECENNSLLGFLTRGQVGRRSELPCEGRPPQPHASPAASSRVTSYVLPRSLAARPARGFGPARDGVAPAVMELV